MAGMMSITGAVGGEPQKAGVAISDIFTGLYSVIAIQAALRHAEKTDRGQFIDMALFDTQISVLGNQNLNYLVSGKSPVQMGNAHMNIAPYEVLPVRDGHIILAVGNDGQFQRFCHVVDLNDLPGDPDFATNSARVVNRARLREAIVARLASYDKAPLLAALEAANVPASPINTIGEMFADPQAIARGMRLDLDDGHGNKLPSVRAPMLMSETPPAYDRPSPRLGEHTAEILAELANLKTEKTGS
jgi:crotonobetainyl-CoA:carnitine CoA-transferase CaiB-like acyl-CoA transferase